MVYNNSFKEYLKKYYNEKIVNKIENIIIQYNNYILTNNENILYSLRDEIYTVMKKINRIEKNEMGKLIHKGKYADVYLYKGNIIKRIYLTENRLEIYSIFFESLMNIYLYYLNNNYVPELYNVGLNEQYGNMQVEYVKYMTFKEVLTSKSYLNLSEYKKYYIILLIVSELGKVIKFYQEKCNFIHGDLKFNNFFVNFDINNICNIKLVDFGFSGLYVDLGRKNYYITNIDSWHYPDYYNTDIKKYNYYHLDLLFFTLNFILAFGKHDYLKNIIKKIVKLFEIEEYDILLNKFWEDDYTFIYEFVREPKNIKNINYFKNFTPDKFIKIVENEQYKIIRKYIMQ